MESQKHHLPCEPVIRHRWTRPTLTTAVHAGTTFTL